MKKYLLAIFCLFSLSSSYAILSTPSLVAPVFGSTNNVPNAVLDWSTVTGATVYEYKLNTDPLLTGAGIVTVSGASQAITANLLFGTNYYWQVRALKTSIPIDSSAWSAIWNFSTLGQLTQVAPVFGAVNQLADVILDWNATSGITNYDYEWDTVATFNSPLNLYASTGTTSQVTTGNLRFGTQYYWRVRARHVADTTQWSTVWSFTTVDVITKIDPVNGATNQFSNVILDWNATSGITNYDYELDTVATFNSPLNLYASTGTTSQATTANLRFGTQYYWRVRARHVADTTQWSTVWSFTTVDVITKIDPVNGATNQFSNVILDWNATSGITNYDYELDTVATFNSPLNLYASTGTTSQATTANLRFGTQYYWRVRARHVADTTQWSTVWSFTTVDIITKIDPVNGATNQFSNVILDWNATSGITNYDYELDTVATFNSPLNLYASTGTTSQATTANLRFGTQYYWRVRARHVADTTQWSTVWSFTTVDVITKIDPVNGATNQFSNVILDWNATSGITNYDYELDTVATFNSPLNLYASTGTTSQANTANLRFGTQYYWRVRARHVADTTQWSTVWSFTTVDVITKIDPVNGATNQFSNVILDWNATSGITNYDYELDTVATFNSPLNLYASTGTTSQATTANLRFGTQYYWRVRARHVADTTQWSTVWSFTTVDVITLLSPANNAISVSLNPTIDWSGITGITGYQYQYSTSSNFSNPTLFTIGTTSQAALSNLSYGTQYFWQVRTFHSADTSDWSLPRSFTTVYQLTTAPSLISPSNNTINTSVAGTSLQWSSVNNATTYEYQYDTDATFTNPVSNSISSLNDLTGALLQNTIYYWRVRAGNGSGFSPWSVTWSFTTEVFNGIANQVKTNSFRVYPNPSSGIFNVVTRSNFGTIEIYNIIGKQVYASEIKSFKTTIDLSSEPAGFYFVRCLINGKINTEKLIIN